MPDRCRRNGRATVGNVARAASHDCRDRLPLAAPTGTATRCPACGRWWFYAMTDNEFGRDWSWRRVYPWSLLGVVAVVIELVQRRGRR